MFKELKDFLKKTLMPNFVKQYMIYIHYNKIVFEKFLNIYGFRKTAKYIIYYIYLKDNSIIFIK